MVNNKTYNNVVNTLLRLGEYHRQISTTSVGDIYDINLEKMQKFPLLHINPTSVATGDSQLTYNFQIFIMDMVTEKADWTTNRNEIVSTSVDEFTKLVKTLSNEQIVNLEPITKLGLLECLTWLSYETDLNSQNKVKRNG